MAAMNTYKAVFERDEGGAWLARIPSIRGCHTYGRTLEQARARLREALGLWIAKPEQAVLDEEIRLPADLRVAIRRSRRTRQRAEREREHAQNETRAAAKALLGEGVSLRDAGELLGLSHQRVQQLVTGRSS
jgi:predicted RNase H-like HicB family nuclease